MLRDEELRERFVALSVPDTRTAENGAGRH